VLISWADACGELTDRLQFLDLNELSVSRRKFAHSLLELLFRDRSCDMLWLSCLWLTSRTRLCSSCSRCWRWASATFRVAIFCRYKTTT